MTEGAAFRVHTRFTFGDKWTMLGFCFPRILTRWAGIVGAQKVSGSATLQCFARVGGSRTCACVCGEACVHALGSSDSTGEYLDAPYL